MLPATGDNVFKELKIFTGNANPALAQEICDHLSVPLAKASVKSFSDGEIMVEIKENVRGRDVFVVQSTCQPSNQNLMELLVMMRALPRLSPISVMPDRIARLHHELRSPASWSPT